MQQFVSTLRLISSFRPCDPTVAEDTLADVHVHISRSMDNGKNTSIGRVARLFLTTPASAIPQERKFSELKRRSSGLRNKTKIEALDRDAIIFSWSDDIRST